LEFPALIATIVSGVTLRSINPTLLSQSWFIAKLSMLILIIIYFFSMEHYRKILKRDGCKRGGSSLEPIMRYQHFYLY